MQLSDRKEEIPNTHSNTDESQNTLRNQTLKYMDGMIIFVWSSGKGITSL